MDNKWKFLSAMAGVVIVSSLIMFLITNKKRSENEQTLLGPPAKIVPKKPRIQQTITISNDRKPTDNDFKGSLNINAEGIFSKKSRNNRSSSISMEWKSNEQNKITGYSSNEHSSNNSSNDTNKFNNLVRNLPKPMFNKKNHENMRQNYRDKTFLLEKQWTNEDKTDQSSSKIYIENNLMKPTRSMGVGVQEQLDSSNFEMSREREEDQSFSVNRMNNRTLKKPMNEARVDILSSSNYSDDKSNDQNGITFETTTASTYPHSQSLIQSREYQRQQSYDLDNNLRRNKLIDQLEEMLKSSNHRKSSNDSTKT